MTRRYGILFVIGLGVALFAAVFQTSPGYMDADYYLMGGIQLAEGQGFTEPILWNYLDDPRGIPHPAHAYWMPLSSILATIGIWITPFNGFARGRIIFLLLAGCIPPMTAWLAWPLLPERGTRTRQRLATLSGVLASFSGFYLPFLTVPDAFGIYMILGALFLGMVSLVNKGKWLVLGIIAGLMHLARADGFVWLGVGLAAVLLQYGIRNKNWILGFGYCLGGYLLVMTPWFARNYSVFGTILAPGGARTLWVLNYDELFSYPASVLTFERWWAVGLEEILSGRLWALRLNLQTALGVQGFVFLFPLMLLGLWKLRKKRAVQLGVLAWGLTLTIMTLVFPFSGARGGFFHSGAAIQPLFWAVAPVGLEAFVEWGERVRGWHVAQAQKVFGAGLVGLAIVVTMAIHVMRAFPGNESAGYTDVEQRLIDFGASVRDVVMVNNPPGYFLASGRSAVVIPDGNLSRLLAAAERYGARFVVLDENVPAGIRFMLDHPADVEGLVYLGALDGFLLFEVEP